MGKEEWLEKVARRVMTAKDGEIKSMAFALITTDGTIETIYSTGSMSDKILIAGTIQMDAMWQSITVNSEEESGDYCDEE